MKTEYSIFNSDCRHFRGDLPCRPHKEHGVHCSNCEYYESKPEKILIIKLGAIGDVIRTTPLLTRMRRAYPDAEIWWLTYYPEVVPSSVDKLLEFTTEGLLTVEETEFTRAYNLDKDHHACALLNRINAGEKYGFMLDNGKPAPVNDLAKPKFLTGLFDDVNKENSKSYLQEIFEICGFEFEGEEYIIDTPLKKDWRNKNDGRPVIGLNTGCGARWVSRMWDEKNWEALIKKFQDEGYYPLLLGGRQEHDKNLHLEEKTGADYKGYFSIKEFISLVNECDVVVTAVTMAMHIAIALKKELILMNNIFNPNEFELYGRGVIVQPDKECKCFFRPKCVNESYFCMDHLPVEKIFDAVKARIELKDK
ncbi:MAG: glycosyltransferase family 9 protein [Bacteroidota bacterium]